jgi:hypothetical protein
LNKVFAAKPVVILRRSRRTCRGAPGLDFETWDTTILEKRIHAVRDLVETFFLIIDSGASDETHCRGYPIPSIERRSIVSVTADYAARFAVDGRVGLLLREG